MYGLIYIYLCTYMERKFYVIVFIELACAMNVKCIKYLYRECSLRYYKIRIFFLAEKIPIYRVKCYIITDSFKTDHSIRLSISANKVNFWWHAGFDK